MVSIDALRMLLSDRVLLAAVEAHQKGWPNGTVDGFELMRNVLIDALWAAMDVSQHDACLRAEAVFDRWRVQVGPNGFSHADGLRFLYALRSAFGQPEKSA